MAKKSDVIVEDKVVEEDAPLDTGGYEGQPVSQFNSFHVWSVNPYQGNGQAKNKDGFMVTLKNGGFKVPLVQIGVTDPKVLFQIGPEMKMTPLKGDTYQVYGNTELRDVYVVGASPVYTAIAQSKVIENGRKVVVPRGPWVRAYDTKGEEIKGVMFTEMVLFLVFKNDPTRKVYRLVCGSNSTDYGKKIVETLSQLAQTYQKLASKRFNKAVGLPARFAFCVTLGVPDEPVKLPTGSFIAPPILKWNDDKIPQTYDEIKEYIVDSKTYGDLVEIAKEVDEYLASPEAPHAIGKLDPIFAARVGVEQLADGSVVKLGELPAPRNATVAAALSAAPAKPQDMTIRQYLKNHTLDEFKDLLATMGIEEPQDFVAAYDTPERLAEEVGTIVEIVELYKSTL